MPTFFQFAVVLFVALGSLTYGYCSSIIATTLGQPTFITYFKLDVVSNADSLIGAINALYQVGGLLGALSCLWIPDKLGRKRALFLGAIFCVVGGALQAGSVHVAMFMVSRFLVGYGVGSLVGLVPLYQSEVAPTKLRGLLVGMHGVLICIGYGSASWIGLGFYFLRGTNSQWRWPLAIQCLPPLFLAIGVLFVPESPRWLLIQDRQSEAFQNFRKVQDSGEGPEHEMAIEQEFRLLAAQVAHEMKHEVPLKDFFLVPSLRKRCVVGFLTLAAAQGTGTLVINNYGPLLYSNLGYGTVLQLVIQSAWISSCIPGNLFNALVVDKTGRKRLLLFGLTGDLIALIGECIAVSIFQRTGSRAIASLAVFFLFLHIALYSVSLDATSYIYSAEIFPTPLRARGVGISITGLFVSTIVYLQAAPVAFANIGWKYYLVFVCVTASMIPVVWFYFPETKGRSLEDIGEVFGDNIALEDEREEEIHRRFKLSQYKESVLTDEKGVAAVHVEEE
ncbi:hypothetical protein AYL99_08234 [Fonsecaea erecta]|uniref:Major facilitator superfamily (MFS) profile domain-containing protein n=1 Tax=Fonsecaea erecta TaxID=1367422 RepID=A0A178ZDG0_9EURO|nr:hypothetical protein AYL99_08234 [Fonsecaea erecta]OAP57496.1 hypothetical protein AYL99_08234 [Fonsecaea erecta]